MDNKTSNHYVKPSTQYKREHKKDYGREKIEILYEDEWLVVINKASGLLSVPYPGSKVRTAQALLEDILRKRGKLGGRHGVYVVHRLDRDTSGVMMFALTEQAQKIIMDSWHTMVTERLYHAIGENTSALKNRIPKKQTPELEPLADQGWITDKLAQNAHNVGYVPKAGAKDKKGHEIKTVVARTHYKKIAEGPSHCLFELSLDTGKKNQIRAHLAAHGYPLAGDEEHRASTNPFGRLCLHARTLEFVHPFTNEKMKFEVAEPDEWLEYVKRGDLNPEVPVWVKGFEGKKHQVDNKSQKYKNHHNDDSGIELGQKRLSRKEESHLDFIQAGKKRR